MLFYVFLGRVLWTITSVVSLVQIETKHGNVPSMNSRVLANETVIDVIRNISRVNNALQELIKNYEQLQKIYKAESFESGNDYSTDSEIDENFKNENHKVKKLRSKVVTVSKAPESFPRTQFTAVDETIETSGSDTDDDAKSDGTDSDSKGRNRLPGIETLQAPHSPSKNEIKTDTSASREKFKEKSPLDKDRENHNNNNKEKPPQIIFIDTHKIHNTSKPTKARPLEPSRNHPAQDTTPKPNTRYKKVDHRNDFRSGFRNAISLTFNVNGIPKNKNSKHVVYSETFPRGKIWDEISKNKPVVLQDDAYFRTKIKKENEVNHGSHLRAGNRTKARNVTPGTSERPDLNKNHKKEKVQKEKKYEVNSLESASDSDSEREEKEINKEIFKTSILRQAYGDACSKVVVRKCYKVCKQVLRIGCSGGSCKGTFKSSFDEHSKTGCKTEFGYESAPKPSPEANNGPSKVPPLRTGEKLQKEDYLAAACWPILRTDKPQKLLKPTSNNTNLNPDEQLNILRDRYEKQCEKISSQKCINACKFSYKKACENNACNKSRNRKFDKFCKAECKHSFRKTKQKKDSDSSEPDSDSDSDSSSTESTSDES